CQVYGLIGQGPTQKLMLLQMLLQPDGKVSKRTLERRMAEALYLTKTILPNTTAGDLRQNRVDSSPYLSMGTSDNDAKTKGIAESTEVTNLAQKLLRQASQQDELELEHDRKSTQLAVQNRQGSISLASSLPVVNHLVDAKLPESRK